MDPITAIGGISAGVGIARGVYDATGRGRARAKKEARKEAERMPLSHSIAMSTLRTNEC
mgnify:CR=1 FL=1